MRKAKSEYSYEEDILYIKPLRDYSSSVQLGNFILDIDKKGQIIGLELLNASKLFNIPKLYLKNIVKAKIQIVVKETVQVFIQLESEIRNNNKLSNLSVEKIKPEYLNESELTAMV